MRRLNLMIFSLIKTTFTARFPAGGVRFAGVGSTDEEIKWPRQFSNDICVGRLFFFFFVCLHYIFYRACSACIFNLATEYVC